MSALIQSVHRQELDEQGYTVLENLFSPSDMAKIAGLIEAHRQRHIDQLNALGGTDGGISRASEITFTDHLAEADSEIMAFVKRPEFIDITTSLLGPDTDLY